MYTCHVCLNTNELGDTLIKCKLCCDGLEQDACNRCAKLYSLYRNTGNTSFFQELQTLRIDGIRKRRKNHAKA